MDFTQVHLVKTNQHFFIWPYNVYFHGVKRKMLMKKILLSFAFLWFVSGSIFSQGCYNSVWMDNVDDYIYPPPDSLPCIVTEGPPFSATIQIYMPGEFHGNVTLDSLIVDSISGLPQGITWFSSPSPLVIYADSVVCVTFYGSSNADSGYYPITFYSHGVVTDPSAGTQTLSYQELIELGAFIPYTQLSVTNSIDSGECHPLPYTPTGISSVITASDWSIYPNPGNGNFKVNINGSKGISGQLAVHDLLGRLIYQRCIESTEQYQTSLDLTNFSPGMYLVQLISKGGVPSAPKAVIVTSAGEE